MAIVASAGFGRQFLEGISVVLTGLGRQMLESVSFGKILLVDCTLGIRLDNIVDELVVKAQTPDLAWSLNQHAFHA